MKTYVDALPPNANKTLVIGYANGNVNAQSMANIVVANLQTIGALGVRAGLRHLDRVRLDQRPAQRSGCVHRRQQRPRRRRPLHVGSRVLGCLRWDQLLRLPVKGGQRPADHGLRTGDMATYVKAGDLYGQTGCFLNLSYNQNWVVAQKWLTGVPESQNIGANELNFSLLGIAG